MSLPSRKAAAIVAFSLFGLSAFAAVQQGPVAVAPAATTGAQAAPIAPVGPEEDILDIRGPIHIPAPFPWAAWTAASLVVIGFGFGAWSLKQRRRRKLPYEIVLEKLERTRPPMALARAGPFSFAISDIVRLFVEECFNVRAAHRTTNEFLHDLVSQPDSPIGDYHETFAEFLQHCDLAKFARWSLSVPQREALLASATAFVISVGKPGSAKKPPAKPAPSTAESVTANA